MHITTVLPAVAALVFIAYLFATAFGRPFKITWVTPALLAATFLIFSLITIIEEGIWSFWITQSTSLWSNQVWIDLLLAIGIAWAFILPKARRVNMSLPLWAIVIPLTGCIGVLAMVARLMWLEDQRAT